MWSKGLTGPPPLINMKSRETEISQQKNNHGHLVKHLKLAFHIPFMGSFCGQASQARQWLFSAKPVMEDGVCGWCEKSQ